MTSHGYVHGYTAYEAGRLCDSARALEDLLHARTAYDGGRVLEAGCGVGAQTGILTRRCPETRFTSIDLSLPSIAKARTGLDAACRGRVQFAQADLFDLPFAPATFDHAFVCYVLEHLDDPAAALEHLRRVVKPGGALTAIEGDHGSAFFHPATDEAERAWACLTEVQRQLGGDALIGRRLFGLMTAAGWRDVRVEPIVIHCDPSRPQLMHGFVDKTIVGMLRGIEPHVLERGLMDKPDWDQGLEDLLRIVTHPAGLFFYVFFRGIGRA